MILKRFRTILTILIISTLFLPFTYETNHTFANDNVSPDLMVSAEILYLRDGPGLSYPVITTLKQGQELIFLEKQDDWYHVKAKDMEGWVASWLTSTTKTTQSDSETNSTIISQVDHLNLRAEPSVSSPVLDQLRSGDEATVIVSENDWIQISYNGTIGWVSSEYVSINTKENNEQETTTGKDNIEPNETTAENNAKLFTVAVDAINIRKKADLSSKKLGTAKKGEQYEVLERDNNWVKIQFGDKKGWVYSFYGTFQADQKVTASTNTDEQSSSDNNFVTIIYNGTNLREQPSTSSNVVVHADAGEKYSILESEDDWYKVKVDNSTSAYVANWVVSANNENVETKQNDKKQDKKNERKKGTLKGVTIVIDPGHGGNDRGTTGVRGTEEKDINLKTVELLKSKLRSAGAEVILTRESDVYVDLRKRVSISHQYTADAFISIHYDATEDSSISGFTTYYTNEYQRELAEYVHAGLSEKVTIRDRGVQPGNYLVTRENKQNAILIELGYLSNASEESIITTDYYREQATLGIYEGLLNYFDSQIE